MSVDREPGSFDDLSAHQEAAECHRAGKAEKADNECRLEIERSSGLDSISYEKQHRGKIKSVEPQDAVLGSRSAKHAKDGEAHGATEQDLRRRDRQGRSEEHTSALQSLMRISNASSCFKKNKQKQTQYKA